MRRRITVLTVGAVVVLGTFAQPAGATHAGAIADCGSAGIFTVKAHHNNAGFQSPAPDKVVVFEEGGTLTVLEFYVNGQLFWSAAQTGRASNNVEEVTCSFANADPGEVFTATGIFTAR